ncbi:collagen alpha-1(XIV) chain-like [Stylophora pistillata]|uniref:collagen alpha-1(XIV) chain-like n=1 Tax=Stylophora pistillata TaxID=50429 RepID=UPI000C03C49A|nr:collagen alpha-1(XIV) chain-like [Stylophora pistillata]
MAARLCGCRDLYLFCSSFLPKIQHVPTKNETATKLVTNFFRIPLSYLSQIGRSKRQVIQEEIVVIIDRSGSIGDCNYKKAKQALKNMLDTASEVGFEDRYAAVTFASTATTDFNFVANPDAGINIKKLPYIPGSTNTQAALAEAKRVFEDPSSGKRPGVVKIAFLITDGHSNVDSSKTIPNANLLRASGVDIFVVAVGNYNSGISEIVEVASPDRKDHIFRVTDMSGFLDVTKLAFKLVAPKKYETQLNHKPLC